MLVAKCLQVLISAVSRRCRIAAERGVWKRISARSVTIGPGEVGFSHQDAPSRQGKGRVHRTADLPDSVPPGYERA